VTFAQPRDVSLARDDARPGSLVPQDPVLPESFGSPCSRQAGPGPAAVHGHCRVLLNSGPESAKVAREFTAAALRRWQLDDLTADAVLVATELVTNAIRYGGCCAAEGGGCGQVELSWQRDANRVICVVTDGSAAPPVLTAGDLDSETGRGLQVVEALASSWGWMRLGATQKAVWAALSFVPAGLSEPFQTWTGRVIRPPGRHLLRARAAGQRVRR